MALPFRFLAACAAAVSLASIAQPLPVFPPKNVPETFYGTVVDDPYRALENLKDPAVASWMKAHADNARKTLDALPGYASLKARVGSCETSSPIVATGALSGEFTWRCENGRVKGMLLMAPTRPPTIQSLDLTRATP